jgi:hypothetical protein
MIHISSTDWERGGKDRDAISDDIREELVFDLITLEQNAYPWVTASNEGFQSNRKNWAFK